MGCCYCDCKEFADQIGADLSTTLLSTEASSILKELQEISSSMKSIAFEPFITSDVEAWNGGDTAAYVRFLMGVKERGKAARVQELAAVKMTEKHYEAATREAVEFYNSFKADLPPPDIDWPIVVCTLASKFIDIQSLQKRVQQLEMRLPTHLKDCGLKFQDLEKLNDSEHVSKDYKDEVESRKRKVAETKATNEEIQTKLKEFRGQFDRVFETARDCVIMLKVFYVEVIEDPPKLVEDNKTQPETGCKSDNKGGVLGRTGREGEESKGMDGATTVVKATAAD